VIFRDKQIQNQLIAWIVYHRTFLYVMPDYLEGEYKECYLHLKDQYESVGKIDAAALPEKFNSLIYSCSDIAIPINHEVVINELSKQYRCIQAYNESMKLQLALENEKNTDDIIINHADKISSIMLGSSESKYNHISSIDKFISEIEDRKKHPGSLKGEASNIHMLDMMIRGWQSGKMYVVGGLKKTGKSRFFINLISPWLARSLSGIVFSMEMNEHDIHTCIMANRLKINTSIIGTSDLSDEKLAEMRAESENYKKQKLIIDRRSALKIIDIKNLIIKNKPNFVIVDYIQRMSGDGEKRVHQVEYCATKLADVARDYNVCMIVLSQLSGRAEHDKASPVYSFFKESQAIIEACDCALVLHDENRGKEKSKDGHVLKCTILQREGVSDFTVDLFAELKYSRFQGVDKTHEETAVQDWHDDF